MIRHYSYRLCITAASPEFRYTAREPMRELLASSLRRAKRLPAFLVIAFHGLWQHRSLSPNPSRAEAAEWLHGPAVRALRNMNVQIITTGKPPNHGLLISNHLSYLDILVFSACVPCVFVSKAEVQSWPIFGTYARWAGSVFVRRHDRADAARANAAVTETLQSDVPVVLFPEGTTTDGSHVLRFHSTMLQPAIDAGCLITPASIDYELDDGDASREVGWWGDMSLVPHVINLFGKKVIRAKVAFGEPMRATGDRKKLSLFMHNQVLSLHRQLRAPSDAQLTHALDAALCSNESDEA